MESFDFSKIHYVFTTVPITKEIPVPIVEVGMFLGQDDVQIWCRKKRAGEDAKMSLILAHAEDQMMSTEVFKVLAEEMIELYKKVNK